MRVLLQLPLASGFCLTDNAILLCLWPRTVECGPSLVPKRGVRSAVAQGRCCGRTTVTEFVIAAYAVPLGGNVSLCFSISSHTTIPDKEKKKIQTVSQWVPRHGITSQNFALNCEKSQVFPWLLIWRPLRFVCFPFVPKKYIWGCELNMTLVSNLKNFMLYTFQNNHRSYPVLS